MHIDSCSLFLFRAAQFISQGARLALLRMAGEMQACLPSSSSPLLQCQSQEDEETFLASRDSGLDEVQRKHLRVAAAALLLKRHLFRYQGTVSAALVLGGVDVIGEHIYQVRIDTVFSASGLGVEVIFRLRLPLEACFIDADPIH